MQKVWSIIKAKARRQAGFSVVEVLLAATVFGFLATALVGALVYGRSSTAGAGDRAQALALAEEGIEAARNIRDSGYGNLTAGTSGIAQSGGTWIQSGGNDTTGIFTRTLAVTAVDSTHKDVVATVTWSNGGVSHSVSSSTRLDNWRATFTTGPVMMAYSKTTSTPFYRTWNGAAWSAEGSAGVVGGNINYIVLKSARTRNESILGTQDASGAIYIQIWNGASWTNKTQVGTGPAANTRSFDIAYEQKSDKAVIVYLPNATSVDFAYRTWDGTTLSGGTTVTTPPTTGIMNWMAVRASPMNTSNDIALISLDANLDVYGMLWDGSSWGTMGAAATWDATASTATKKAIDVEYEQNTGRALFMWGDSVAGDQYYRIWNGSSLTAATQLTIAAEGGVVEWLQLAARPSSDEIMLGVQDAGADLNTRKWSGSAWDAAATHPEHSAATENIASMNFDIVWETHSSNPGKAWLVWGDGATMSQKAWSAGAWGAGSVIATTDDTSFVRLYADPYTGAVFLGNYQNSGAAAGVRDIAERHLTGGGAVWSAKSVIWGGNTSADPVFFRIDFAVPKP